MQGLHSVFSVQKWRETCQLSLPWSSYWNRSPAPVGKAVFAAFVPAGAGKIVICALPSGVACPELIAILQYEMQLVGNDFHWLPGRAGFARLGFLTHASVLEHVKVLGLVVGLKVEDKRIGRPVAQIIAAGVELGTAGDDGLEYSVLRSHVEVTARTTNIHYGRSPHLDIDVAFGLRVLNGIVGLEQHRELVGGEGTVRLIDSCVQKNSLTRVLLNGAT